MKSITLRQQKGFSLVELMIVVAIIGIGVAVSWEGLSSTRNQTKVNGACESVAVMVNKARSYALAGLPSVNMTRINCASGTCKIQKSTDGGASWSDISGDAYNLPAGVSLSDFSIAYTLPYANPSSTSSTDRTLTAGSSSATLVTSDFKASCR